MNITPANKLSAQTFSRRLSDARRPLYEALNQEAKLPEGVVPESMQDRSLGDVSSQRESDFRRFRGAKAKVEQNQSVASATQGSEVTATDVISEVYRRSNQDLTLATVSTAGFGLGLGAAVWGFANLSGGSSLSAPAAVFGGIATGLAAAGAVIKGAEAFQGRRSAQRLGQWQAHFASNP